MKSLIKMQVKLFQNGSTLMQTGSSGNNYRLFWKNSSVLNWKKIMQYLSIEFMYWKTLIHHISQINFMHYFKVVIEKIWHIVNYLVSWRQENVQSIILTLVVVVHQRLENSVRWIEGYSHRSMSFYSSKMNTLKLRKNLFGNSTQHFCNGVSFLPKRETTRVFSMTKLLRRHVSPPRH